MTNFNPFSMSTMLNSLPHIEQEPTDRAVPTLPRGINLFPQSPETTLSQRMFNIMTNYNEEQADTAWFNNMVRTLNRIELQRMASSLTSNSDYFFAIAKNKNGSKRLQRLLGRSDEVDGFFAVAIMRRFLHVITDKHASRVAVKGLRVFDEEKKELLYEHVLLYALDIARDEHGCVALNEIITDLDNLNYRDQLFDIVAVNALLLSNDAYGNFVVQHVLSLHDLRCAYNIAVNLRGHCVDLSFKKYGSYVVEKLLKTEKSMAVVVEELLGCEGNRLMRLARSEFGNFVMYKALRSMNEEPIWFDMFCRLVKKLAPFLGFLFACPRSKNIARLLETVLYSLDIFWSLVFG
ncbi:unnamed protein product [Cochlearia groenlandica]